MQQTDRLGTTGYNWERAGFRTAESRLLFINFYLKSMCTSLKMKKKWGSNRQNLPGQLKEAQHEFDTECSEKKTPCIIGLVKALHPHVKASQF